MNPTVISRARILILMALLNGSGGIGLRPAAAQPAVSATTVGANLQLGWPVNTNFDSQVETSGQFLNWQRVWPPHPAPLAAGWQTNVFSFSKQAQFFRVRYGWLTNSPVPTAPGVYSLAFVSGRLARSYRLNIPTNYNPAISAPLAFILHGHGQTAASFAAQHPDLAQLANAAGMILAFPQSTSNERGTGWVNYDSPDVNDVQFLLDLLEHLAGALNVDRQRVYAAGFSNGGQMVHFLGARTTNTFAAYAAVGASIGGSQGGTNIVFLPPPAEPMSILIVNATNDCQRPFWGGPNAEGSFQPAALTAADHWTSNNLCLAPPVVTRETNVFNANLRPDYADDCPNANPPPNTSWTNHVTRTTWLGGTNWTEVTFVELSDGGHLWPDADDNVGFDANSEVLGFFLRHCRCDATGATNNLVVPTAPGQYDRQFCDQGYWRKFRLMIPAGYTGAAAAPLLFTFHGGEQTIAEFGALHPDLFAKCNAEGVLLVLPEATGHPRSRATLWGNKPFEIVVDDRSLVTNLLTQLDAVLNINRKKVYAAGFSNGGRFGNWFAATWPGWLAGLAPVCSQIGWNDPVTGALVAPPAPVEPLPVFMVRGSLDARQPFFGGTNDTGQLAFAAADDLAFWVSANTCAPPPVTNTVGIVSSWHYPSCAGGTEARLEGVSGLGHEWPEATAYNASLRIVDFLLPFSRP